MKTCPKCKLTYSDDMDYCTSDGAPLLAKKAKAKKHSRINEVVSVLLVCLAVLVFLAVATYSPTDWSLNTASSESTRNWIGIGGALVADLLRQSIGITSIIIPALLAVVAWRVFHSESLRPRLSRVAGFLMILVAASGMVHMAGWHGGVLGAFVYQYTSGLIGSIGTAILLMALFTASLLLVTDLTFSGFFGHFGEAWSNFQPRVKEWFAKKEGVGDEETARARAEKRREIRTGRTGELPATLLVPETPGESMWSRLASRFQRQRPVTGTLLGIEPAPTVMTPAAPTTAEIAPSRTGKFDSGMLAASANGVKAVEDPLSEEIAPPPIPVEPEEAIRKPKKRAKTEGYELPATDLLTAAPPQIQQRKDELQGIAQELSDKSKEFNVAGEVVGFAPGPVVTTYEFKPDKGVKYSRVTGLVDDLCLALKAESIRIDRIPGKAYVGIEVPNPQRETIFLRQVLESRQFTASSSLLTIALGKTISGENYVTDLAKMPHLLIAGATGAGKSVGVNSLIVSILYKASPDEVKFIMVDPKRLELGVYKDIPHLAAPIITDPKQAATSLRWAVKEMERRYKYLATRGVRNIDGYNAGVEAWAKKGDVDDQGNPFTRLPYIVIIIDELADLMMVSGKDVEEAITRLAQMARAVGIHLVLATQRPSVDVITGLIKANFPSRISFRVSSKVDSRTIIDSNGAESLLGKGDMLFLPPGSSQLVRVHGAYVDEKEIAHVVDFIKEQFPEEGPVYDETITRSEEEMDESDDLPGRRDPLFWDAVRSVVQAKRASTSGLQRHLRIGYGRAAAILDAMAREGYIGEMDGSTRARPILEKAYHDLQDIEEMGNS